MEKSKKLPATRYTRNSSLRMIRFLNLAETRDLPCGFRLVRTAMGFILAGSGPLSIFERNGNESNHVDTVIVGITRKWEKRDKEDC
ncbi:unnamed protein product [Gongylonema pulchrum]|uniref:Protein kinase domain-containing protein n=1 Tax=Gongylonema pulchrum TaxID=637853 RepID=A0A183E4K7_9BILA|nr:unnamed protein product [Gongylonema pulchrum]